MNARQIADKINKEYPELHITHSGVRTLKFRKIIEGDNLYEQALIAKILRKKRIPYRDIIKARKYWLEGFRDEEVFLAVLLGIGLKVSGLDRNKKSKLTRLGVAIKLYGAYLNALKKGLNLKNLSFKTIVNFGREVTIAYEFTAGEKDRHKEYEQIAIR
ncbi:MAG: hypothetical protein ACP5KK_03305 [Candidatus Nanoarchaeia archaeon]